VSGVRHQPFATAALEPYGGPPGRLDVADVITAADGAAMAAGLCIAEGGPLVYRVDYDAVVVALDHDLVWEDAEGPQPLAPGDIVWLPEGARNNYWSTGTSRFFYTTWPANWAEIVGWQAGRDIKDLAAQSGPEGDAAGIRTLRRASARFGPAEGGAAIARLLGGRDGISMGAGLIRLDGSGTWTAPCEMALVALEGGLAVAADGRLIDAAEGDLVWLPAGCTLAWTGGGGLAAWVCCPADGLDQA